MTEEAGRKYLIFTLPGHRYAVDLAQVAEVDEPPTLWPIPGAPPSYPGAMNFHGSIVAVMDLTAFVGLPAGRPAEKVIVLAPAIASLALLVERVEQIVPASRVRAGATDQAQDAPFSHHPLHLADGTSALLLDVDELVRAATEAMAAL